MKRKIDLDYSDEFDWGYEEGWDECKKEVLRILKDHESENCDPFAPSPFGKCIEKIENL